MKIRKIFDKISKAIDAGESLVCFILLAVTVVIAVFPAYGGLKNIFFRGPDGEQIELFQYYPTNQ